VAALRDTTNLKKITNMCVLLYWAISIEDQEITNNMQIRNTSFLARVNKKTKLLNRQFLPPAEAK